jgi:PadR family transcriptional regulator, regulatory protein PadR
MLNLGNLEETILLLVILMKGEAYAYALSKEYEAHTGKSISISAVHTVLTRLEKKHLIRSEMGGATDARGGRRKRLFQVTALGERTVQEMKESRFRLWRQIPGFDLS